MCVVYSIVQIILEKDTPMVYLAVYLMLYLKQFSASKLKIFEAFLFTHLISLVPFLCNVLQTSSNKTIKSVMFTSL